MSFRLPPSAKQARPQEAQSIESLRPRRNSVANANGFLRHTQPGVVAMAARAREFVSAPEATEGFALVGRQRLLQEEQQQQRVRRAGDHLHVVHSRRGVAPTEHERTH